MMSMNCNYSSAMLARGHLMSMHACKKRWSGLLDSRVSRCTKVHSRLGRCDLIDHCCQVSVLLCINRM
ncbi:uncharacterized protein PgNI_02891 [Pyricularia grisea]|uniref:Uncharacterized protein n=1 Tax=Pyricularia grisea TaxID=148305 RepID=A0A6P8BDB4_PYRGI|nr:uncharacterized protein PgNI_02891 [Pyricularia grisea]TLD13866.1 hypothetical protein PgNI_02891 [Pyricularia grisea]